eukprot:TRINITY_DN1748_c0_g1_i1.p1 TRINITY_DN1748_c0_g1~~TRINITY_DN1748_c0_g1_i1.p1  ORF type:complete len:435 (+),score=47.00 TRINITY_DN1748_c0_g1_i1:181-1485(+)
MTQCSEFQERDVQPILPPEMCGNLTQNYLVLRNLGQGAVGDVCLCEDRKSGMRWASKSMRKKRANQSAILREFQSLKALEGHPFTIRLHEACEDETSVHFVMELCEGGDLCDCLAKYGTLTEEEAVCVVQQLVSALDFCHSKGIMHRDIKPENILIKSRPGTCSSFNAAHCTCGTKRDCRTCNMELEIKLADFGHAVFLPLGRKASGRCGSLFYMAPEMVRKQLYSHAIDIWSLGMVMYAAISGKLPFTSAHAEIVHSQICRGNFDFSSDHWKKMSMQCKDLIKMMLDTDPLRRPTASDLLKHPWIQGHILPPNFDSPSLPTSDASHLQCSSSVFSSSSALPGFISCASSTSFSSVSTLPSPVEAKSPQKQDYSKAKSPQLQEEEEEEEGGGVVCWYSKSLSMDEEVEDIRPCGEMCFKWLGCLFNAPPLFLSW